MDDASRAERDSILDTCVRFAQQMIDDRGEFFPFGVSLRGDGLVMDAAYDEGENAPDLAVAVRRLVAEHRAEARAGGLRACGTTMDVRVTDADGVEQDAICVDIEHRTADPVRCLLPYERAGDTVEYGKLFAVRLAPDIFTR